MVLGVESLRGSNRQELVSKNGYISAARYWEVKAAAGRSVFRFSAAVTNLGFFQWNKK